MNNYSGYACIYLRGGGYNDGSDFNHQSKAMNGLITAIGFCYGDKRIRG